MRAPLSLPLFRALFLLPSPFGAFLLPRVHLIYIYLLLTLTRRIEDGEEKSNTLTRTSTTDLDSQTERVFLLVIVTE